MATRDGLAQIWYADTNGVVTGYTPTADNVASAIIDTYNEHFGTDINIWTPETKTLQVGDTVPNWNAYEKIVLASQKIAAKSAGFGENYFFIIGTLGSENFEIVTNGNVACIVNSSGIITGYNAPSASDTEDIIDILQRNGLSASSITEKVVSWEVGTAVPDWAEYTQYK